MRFLGIIISLFAVCTSSIVDAATVSSGSFDFGVLMQNNSTSTITISNGTYTKYSGIYNPPNLKISNKIDFTTTISSTAVGSFEKFNIPCNQSFTKDYGGCKVILEAVTADGCGVNKFLARGDNRCNVPTVHSFYFDLNLRIEGYCKASNTPYEGQFTLNYEYYECKLTTSHQASCLFGGSFKESWGNDNCSQSASPPALTIGYSLKISEPVDVVEVTKMNFGTIISTSSPQSVTLNTDGTYTASNGSNVITGGHPAKFFISGVGGSHIYVTFPSSIILRIPGNSGGPTMEVSEIQAKTTDGAPIVSGDFIKLGGTEANRDSMKYFYIGGKLNINANQQDGSYHGEYEVNVHN